jgi:hypothetical protein
MKTKGNNSTGKSNDGVSLRRAFWACRLFLGISLIFFLAGPTPGAVGSCSKDDKVLDAAAIPKYCKKIALYLCAREYTRSDKKDADSAKYELCAQNASSINSTMWCPSSYECPRATKRPWDACIRALQSTTTLDKKNLAEIPECRLKRLCEASPNSSNYLDAGESDAGDNNDN